MEAWSALTGLFTLLVGGFLLGALAERLRQSAILGYLLAGMLLGPYGFRLVAHSDDVAMLAELGVALLLFSIGLEFSWGRLRQTGGRALAGGAAQVTLTIFVALGVGALVGADLRVAFVLGAALALSSTAYVLRLLGQRAQLDSSHGRLSLAVLIVQDLAVVPLVLLVGVLRTGQGPAAALLELARLLGFAALLVVGFLLVFHQIVPRLLGTDVLRRNRELPLLLALASGLGSALAAHALGLSPAIGAFLAGLLLAESPFATQVRADISSLRTVLMVLFFGSIGMFGDPIGIARDLLPVLGLVAGVVVAKTVLVYAALRLMRLPARPALAAGLGLAQVGEFSFVLAEMAHPGLIGDRLFQAIVSVTVVTLFATPFLLRWAPSLAHRVFGAVPAPAGTGDGATGTGHVLVVGFGPTGQAVSGALREAGHDVHVVDLNPRSIREAEKRGYHAHVGDASHPDVLEHLRVSRALAIAVTLPDPDDCLRVVEHVRSNASCPRIFVRSRYHRHAGELRDAGAHVVIDEEEEMGRALAAALTRELHP